MGNTSEILAQTQKTAMPLLSLGFRVGVCGLLVAACSPSDQTFSSAEREALELAPQIEIPAPSPQSLSIGPRLIRSGAARVEVEDLDSAVVTTRLLAEQARGYIAGSELIAGREGARSASLVLRLPSDSFESFLEGLSALGRVLSLSVVSSDVSPEYVDVETRLAVKEEMVSRLRQLAARGGDLEDLLAAERELGRAVSELEALKGQLRYLDQRIAESELRLSLIEPGAVIGSGAFRPVAVAFRRATEVFAQSVAYLVYLVVFLLPWVLLALAAWPVVRRLIRLRKQRAESGAGQ